MFLWFQYRNIQMEDSPICPYPNPEVKEALELGLRDAKTKKWFCFLAIILIYCIGLVVEIYPIKNRYTTQLW